jgi:iron complex outermembrane receptor protein
LFLSLVSHAQTKISGVVKDAESGDALVGASVQIEGTNIGSTTNSEGKFVIENVGDNSRVLRISYVGYETVLRNVGSDNALDVNVGLYKKEILSNQIVVTASRNEQMIGDIAGRVELISPRAVASTPKLSTDDLFKNSSAVMVDRTSGIFSHSAVVNVRGITAGEQGRVLALVDGLPINKSDGGTVNWNRINPEDVERVEIFKGPGSSVYGNNAMGGVVNIISKKSGKLGYSGFAAANYGTFNTVEERVSVSGKLEEGFSFRVSGFNRTSDGYNTYREAYRDAFSINQDLKESGVDAKLGYQINDKTKVSINYSFYDDERGQGTKVREDNIMKHKTNYGTVLFNTEIVGVKVDLNIFYQMENYLRVMEKYKAAGTTISSYDLIDVDADRGDYGANLNFTIPLENNLLIAGVEYKKGKVDGSDSYRTTYYATTKTYKAGTDVLTNRGTLLTLAAFVQDEYRLTNDLKLNAGLRIDNVKFQDGEYVLTNPSKNNDFLKPFAGPLQEYDWTSVTPKFSAHYKLTENLNAYVAYSQGFRAATLDDLTRPGLIKLGFKNANPNLKPEKIENMELGANYDLDQKFYIMPSVYYMTGKDFMYYINTGKTVNVSGRNRPIIIKDNITKVRFIGGDVDVKYFVTANLNLFANYAYTKTKILGFIGNTALEGKELTYTPNSVANIGVTYLNQYVNASFNYHFQSKQFLNDDNSEKDVSGNSMIIAATSTFEAKLWKKLFDVVNISLEVQNLLNKQTLATYDRISIGRMITGGISVEL